MKKILGVGLCVLALTGLTSTVSAVGLGDIQSKAKTAKSAAKDIQEVAKAMAVTAEQEREIGASINPQILSQMGGSYPNKAVGDYVNRVGQKLAAKSTRKDVNYTFAVVNSPAVNAFALPGGYIYITRGMLASMKDEAELAAVLGHEIGHVEKRHGVARVQKMVLADKTTKYTAKYGGQAAGKAIGGAGGAISSRLINELTKVFTKAVISGYGRSQELESDRIGIRLANASGYDPNGAVRLFETLSSLEGGKKKGGGIYASHPDTKKRIEQARDEVAKIPSPGKATNKPQYAAIQRKI